MLISEHKHMKIPCPRTLLIVFPFSADSPILLKFWPSSRLVPCTLSRLWHSAAAGLQLGDYRHSAAPTPEVALRLILRGEYLQSSSMQRNTPGGLNRHMGATAAPQPSPPSLLFLASLVHPAGLTSKHLHLWAVKLMATTILR